MPSAIHHKILIIGGGTAGITVAARLARRIPSSGIGLIEPSDKHYYQPLWTLVGGGIFPKKRSEREEAGLIPKGVTWIRDAVTSFQPEANCVTTRDGKLISYDWLIVAPGIQVNWGKLPGLKESIGTRSVCSNYSYEHVDYTWETLRNFKKGTALFTHPAGAVKCGGAPQKIMYLAEDWLRRQGLRGQTEVVFNTALPKLFAVEKYRLTLEKHVADRGIKANFNQNLIELRPDAKEAVFEEVGTKAQSVMRYDMIHITPPMGPPDFVKSSPLANGDGWVEVDKINLRHARFPNVFALGDASSLPTSKTGAAIRKQAPVVVENLLAAMQGQPPTASYNGYTSCPIVTARGKLVMAEFDYDGKPQETFPFDQGKERYSMYLVKKWLLPELYWHGMLRGLA
jgi:sulfide:quinone oxidoreductase